MPSLRLFPRTFPATCSGRPAWTARRRFSSPICEEKDEFRFLGLHEALTKAVADSGYDTATDVQLQAIPPALPQP